MTITTLTSKVEYIGDGVATVFSFNFKTTDPAQITVLENGGGSTTVILVINPDQELNPGGTVTFDIVPPAVGTVVSIIRLLDLDQQMDYNNYTKFPAESHELALDELTMMTQQLQEAFTRAISVPYGRDPATDLTFPAYESGKLIAWDDTLKKLVNTDGSGGGAPPGTIDHNDLLNIGTISHAGLDNHVVGASFLHTAATILFNDNIVNQGFGQVQEVLDFFDIQIALRETAATGLITGGIVTAAAGTTVNVSAGEGEIIDGYTARRDPTRLIVTWNADPAFPITLSSAIGSSIIFINPAGVISQSSTPLTPSQRRNSVQLAVVSYKDGVLTNIDLAGISSNEVGNFLYDWLYFTPFNQRAKGLDAAAHNTLLSIWAKSGEFLSPGINIDQSITNANIKQIAASGSPTVAQAFDILFEDGSTQAIAATVIPKYWEDTDGITSSLNGQRATVHYIYRDFSGNLYLQLGRVEYDNGVTARDSMVVDLETQVPFTGSENFVLVSQIYVSNSASDFSDTTTAGISSLIGGGGGGGGGGAGAINVGKGASVFRSGDVPLIVGLPFAVPWLSELYDDLSFHPASSSSFIVPANVSRVELTTLINFDPTSNSGAYRRVEFLLNGTSIVGSTIEITAPAAGHAPSVYAARTVNVLLNDILEVEITSDGTSDSLIALGSFFAIKVLQ